MAQATDIKPRTITFSGPPALAILALAFATVILIAALVVPTLFTSAAIQPRSEAVLDAGRAWQAREIGEPDTQHTVGQIRREPARDVLRHGVGAQGRRHVILPCAGIDPRSAVPGRVTAA